MTEIGHLPKSVQKLPHIRALTLRVYPGDGPRHYRVPGESNIYDVFRLNNTFTCSCKAASSRAKCAHVYAVQNYCAQQKGAPCP